jgi:hypothetical protein
VDPGLTKLADTNRVMGGLYEAKSSDWPKFIVTGSALRKLMEEGHTRQRQRGDSTNLLLFLNEERRINT